MTFSLRVFSYSICSLRASSKVLSSLTSLRCQLSWVCWSCLRISYSSSLCCECSSSSLSLSRSTSSSSRCDLSSNSILAISVFLMASLVSLSLRLYSSVNLRRSMEVCSSACPVLFSCSLSLLLSSLSYWRVWSFYCSIWSKDALSLLNLSSSAVRELIWELRDCEISFLSVTRRS